MKRVYTKTGDKGTTGIHGGMRVPKDDIRIEANGCLDELNAVIGIVRSMLAAKDAWQELLHAVQRELMVVMSHVATPSGVVNPNPLSAAELTLRCEQEMDAMTVLLTDNGYFLLPGGTPISAQLQFARTVARRAERRLWTLHRQDPVNEDILRFINRLSDLFFVMARMEMQRQDWPTSDWIYVPDGHPVPQLSVIQWHVSVFRKPIWTSYTSRATPHSLRQSS